MSEFIPLYDLDSLTEPQRQDYIRNVCNHMGVPDNLNLVALTYIDDGDGPAHLVPYAKRGALEIVRNNLQIDVTSLTNQMIGGSIVFTATAKSKVTGRQEISTGSKFIEGLTGTPLDDAIMASQTRALRRVTLQFIGAGVLDESEVNQRKLIHTVSVPMVATPQPTVQPANEPGKDITESVKLLDEKLKREMDVGEAIKQVSILPLVISSPAVSVEETAGLLDESKRLQAIEQMNAQVDTEPKVKRTRKKRSVDLGPSEVPAPVSSPQTAVPEPTLVPPVEQAVVAATSQQTIVAAQLTAPPAQKIPKTPAALQTGFRQRLYRLRTDYLENAGFAPKENFGGTPDQLRALAKIMFSDINDMNDFTPEHWEKFLSTLEKKVEKDGAASAVKFIEDTIGVV
jgi:hypothetical protein